MSSLTRPDSKHSQEEEKGDGGFHPFDSLYDHCPKASSKARQAELGTIALFGVSFNRQGIVFLAFSFRQPRPAAKKNGKRKGRKTSHDNEARLVGLEVSGQRGYRVCVSVYVGVVVTDKARTKKCLTRRQNAGGSLQGSAIKAGPLATLFTRRMEKKQIPANVGKAGVGRSRRGGGGGGGDRVQGTHGRTPGRGGTGISAQF